jgi:N-acetylmuramoyl-L-alanine amidase
MNKIKLILLCLFLSIVSLGFAQDSLIVNIDSLDNVKSVQEEKESKKIKKYIVILDAAHGSDVPGKRSPDGKFFEYQFSREIISLLGELLDSAGIKYGLDNKTDIEIGLNTRVVNTNKLVKKYGKNALFISIHVNAAGMGDEWLNARGWSIYTTYGFTRGDKLAEKITSEFEDEFPDIKNRGMLEAGFKVLKCKPPAVLIETLFQDNKDDVDILTSDDFKIRYSHVILKGIIDFILND